jgi:hypothetical protein
MWYLLQMAVMFAVMCVAIHFNWAATVGPHSLAPAAIAVFAAWIATKFVSLLVSQYRKLH